MNRPLRIGLLTHSVLPRGGVVHAVELAGALAARGHAVTLIAPAEPGQALFRRPPCATALLPMARPQGPLVEQVRQRIEALVQALPPVLAAGRFDILHAQDSLNGNALARLAAAGRCPAPWVRTVHHLDDFTDAELADWQRTGWRAARAIGCVSDLWCRHFKQAHGLVPQRLFNGVDLQRFTLAPQPGDAAILRGLGGVEAPAGRIRVLALGGIEARKNSVRLLRAFAALRATDPAWHDAQLVVAGGASLLDHGRAVAEWQAARAELGLGDGPQQPVWRLGPVADEAVAPLMRAARLLAMPSLVEGFGLVALEALACGTPVLVSRQAPFTEHLAGTDEVAWCEPTDVASIAAGLREAALRPRPVATPPVCLAHGWARSAEVHEGWYHALLAAVPPSRQQAAARLPRRQAA